jgi:hypothetical protein
MFLRLFIFIKTLITVKVIWLRIAGIHLLLKKNPLLENFKDTDILYRFLE